MNSYLKKLFHPVTLIVFIVLVGIMASQTNLGTDGITYAVVITGVTLAAIIGLSGVVKRKFNEMLDGKPGLLDFGAAPSGYRRARQAETESEAAQRSHVTPTPNRPLVVDAKPASAVQKAPTSRVLRLAENCNPPVSMVIGSCICFLGQRGSGKSYSLARFLEQILQFPLAALIGDVRMDYASLPDVLTQCVVAGAPDYARKARYPNYRAVTRETARQLGVEIMQRQVRVVLLLNTFEQNESAYVMAEAIDGMFAWTAQQAEQDLYPALVVLDEAESMVPQNPAALKMEPAAVAGLSHSVRKTNSQGRGSGLTLIVSTQRPANIDKSVIAGTEIWFLGKQTNPRDLDYYKEIIGNDAYRAAVTAFDQGDFLVVEGGEVLPIHFDKRQSKHKNTTPSLTSALKFSQKAAQLPAPSMERWNQAEAEIPDEDIVGYAMGAESATYDEIETRPEPHTDALMIASRTPRKATVDQYQQRLRVARGQTTRKPASYSTFARESVAVSTLVPVKKVQEPVLDPLEGLSSELRRTYEAYENQMSYRDLGPKLGVSKDTAGKWVIRLQDLGYISKDGMKLV